MSRPRKGRIGGWVGGKIKTNTKKKPTLRHQMTPGVRLNLTCGTSPATYHISILHILLSFLAPHPMEPTLFYCFVSKHTDFFSMTCRAKGAKGRALTAFSLASSWSRRAYICLYRPPYPTKHEQSKKLIILNIYNIQEL